ncbi:MAG: alpha/beta hydrolase [Ilumatobacteraceae bacterium]
MTERIEYDEFSYFQDNASEYGIPYDGPPVVRRRGVDLGDGRSLSALVWGDEPPRLVFLHGGAQNAHTWDTVALALGVPMVAIDLPGHGHSDGPAHAATDPMGLAADVVIAIRELAPDADAVVGMSLGGLTTIAVSHLAPELVRSMVLVDVTPGVNREKGKAIAAFVNGPKTFPSFEELLARTIEHNPTRTESSLRRGILHNAVQLDDGSWMWRYRRFDDGPGSSPVPGEPATTDASEATGTTDTSEAAGGPGAQEPFERFGPLWDALAAFDGPSLLVRGMRPQSVVADEDEDRFLELAADPTVARIDEAGHSVQGDTPVELAELIREFVGL